MEPCKTDVTSDMMSGSESAGDVSCGSRGITLNVRRSGEFRTQVRTSREVRKPALARTLNRSDLCRHAGARGDGIVPALQRHVLLRHRKSGRPGCEVDGDNSG